MQKLFMTSKLYVIAGKYFDGDYLRSTLSVNDLLLSPKSFSWSNMRVSDWITAAFYMTTKGNLSLVSQDSLKK